MSMTNREAQLELLYNRLPEKEQIIIDHWDKYSDDDRTALKTTLSADARRYLYMVYNAR